MASVNTCADFFIEISNYNEDFDMTNMKLNKLLYYAQGTHLARTGHVLFEEGLQAWQHGPVVPEIYFKYSSSGNQPICNVDKNYSYQLFSEDELTTLMDVMREYGKFTASTLRNLTHQQGTPWSIVYEEGKKKRIPKHLLKSFFTENPVRTFKLSDKIPTVRKLPKDWYDPSEDSVWESC